MAKTRRVPSARRTVLFVGAGASAPAGYPLTGQLLDRIWGGLHQRDSDYPASKWAGLQWMPNGRRQLIELIQQVFPGLQRTDRIEGASIIDVLSLADLMVLEGRSAHPDATHEDLRRQRTLLDVAMNGVLQGTKKAALRRQLAQWSLQRAAAHPDGRLTVVTTNFDTLLEREIYKCLDGTKVPVERAVDLGMPWRSLNAAQAVLRPQDAPLAVLKLHGSLDWLRCEVCGYMSVNPRKRIHSLAFWRTRSAEGYNVCACGGRLRSTLVVPSTIRDVRDANLLGIWQAALEEIRLADRLVILGYSLPYEDVAIRSMLLRALHGRAPGHALRVDVVQHEPLGSGATAFPRFRTLFTEAQLPRERYHTEGVEAWAATQAAAPTPAQFRKSMGRLVRRVGRA